jgi:hypothetical protein
MDDGPVIAAREVPVRSNDTAETLAARVLAEEHILYPEVVRQIAVGDITIRNGRIESKAPIRHHDEDTIKETEHVIPMSHQSIPPVADPEAVKRAHDMWNAFTKASLIAGGAVAVTLVLMAVFLV